MVCVQELPVATQRLVRNSICALSPTEPNEGGSLHYSTLENRSMCALGVFPEEDLEWEPLEWWTPLFSHDSGIQVPPSLRPLIHEWTSRIRSHVSSHGVKQLVVCGFRKNALLAWMVAYWCHVYFSCLGVDRATPLSVSCISFGLPLAHGVRTAMEHIRVAHPSDAGICTPWALFSSSDVLWVEEPTVDHYWMRWISPDRPLLSYTSQMRQLLWILEDDDWFADENGEESVTVPMSDWAEWDHCNECGLL